MNCRCHCCREYGSCDEPHTDKELRWAKHIPDGSYWWGKGMENARGRRVKICEWCINNFDSEGVEEVKAGFFPPTKGGA